MNFILQLLLLIAITVATLSHRRSFLAYFSVVRSELREYERTTLYS